MKGIVLFTWLQFLVLGCMAQCHTIKLDDTSFTILNEKIKYSIVLMACSKCAPIRNIGERVIVQFTEREKM
jgi:hypothetical protein